MLMTPARVAALARASGFVARMEYRHPFKRATIKLWFPLGENAIIVLLGMAGWYPLAESWTERLDIVHCVFVAEAEAGRTVEDKMRAWRTLIAPDAERIDNAVWPVRS